MLLTSKERLCRVEESIKQYQANNDQCRRDFLFRDMDEYHLVDMGSKSVCVVTLASGHASVVLVLKITNHVKSLLHYNTMLR
jgi:hypothetical protein